MNSSGGPCEGARTAQGKRVSSGCQNLIHPPHLMHHGYRRSSHVDLLDLCRLRLRREAAAPTSSPPADQVPGSDTPESAPDVKARSCCFFKRHAGCSPREYPQAAGNPVSLHTAVGDAQKPFRHKHAPRRSDRVVVGLIMKQRPIFERNGKCHVRPARPNVADTGTAARLWWHDGGRRPIGRCREVWSGLA